MDWIRDLVDAIKHGRRPYSLMERKVREATRDEPWGPHGQVLQALAAGTDKHAECDAVIAILLERLSTPPGPQWRVVYKALVVAEYLLQRGDDACARRVHAALEASLRGLVAFEYADAAGRDHGVNVRHKAKALLAMVTNADVMLAARSRTPISQWGVASPAAGAGQPANGAHADAGGARNGGGAAPLEAGQTKGVSKHENDRHLAALAVLSQRPCNRKCADCESPVHAPWASVTCGVFLCLRCAGVHRGLGVHVSQVRSCVLDGWLPNQVAFMAVTGNDVAGAYWESRLPPGFLRPTGGNVEGKPPVELVTFAERKYGRRAFADPNGTWPPTVPTDWAAAVARHAEHTRRSGTGAMGAPRVVITPMAASTAGGGFFASLSDPGGGGDDDFGDFTGAAPAPAASFI